MMHPITGKVIIGEPIEKIQEFFKRRPFCRPHDYQQLLAGSLSFERLGELNIWIDGYVLAKDDRKWLYRKRN